MVVFICWMILLASEVAAADVPQLGRTVCGDNDGYNLRFCLTLGEDEVRAETGLCAVIHCTFNIPSYFYPSSLVWFRNSGIIFHSKNPSKIQSSFSGRVSLLEPDLSRGNCSIIINDLRRSDSGEYHLRLNRGSDGFSFLLNKAKVSVRALQQKPTVLSPALTEGQHASLTCTAPGLCSRSEPTFTWTWRGPGQVRPNITTATTILTPVNHRHSSTLELTASAELHGAEFICRVSYNHSMSSTQDSVRVNVTYVKDIEVSGDTVVKEGDSLNVSCSVDSFPPSRLIWFGPNRTSLTESESSELSNQTDLGSASLLIHNVTQSQSGLYMCEGLHLNSSQTRGITVSVIYLREPVLTGDTDVVEGGALQLTCSVDSFPLSNVTLRGAGVHMNSSQTEPGSVSLFISNVTLGDAGPYECTVEHELRTLFSSVDVKVLLKPRILDSSGCVLARDVLTCVCVSRASPAPTISWPLLQDYSEYTLVTTVSGDRVNSSLVLRASEPNGTVQCVSSNGAGRAQESFTPSISSSDPPVTDEKFMQAISRTEVIVAFIAGYLLAVVFCCLVITCRRKKQEGDIKERDMSETLEMVNSEVEPEVAAATSDGVLEQMGILNFSAPQTLPPHPKLNSLSGPAGVANAEPGELHYASINFAALARRGQRDGAHREDTKTEYAEIRRDFTNQLQEYVEEQEEKPQDEEDGAMTEDTRQSVPEEEEGAALYSNMKDILANE